MPERVLMSAEPRMARADGTGDTIWRMLHEPMTFSRVHTDAARRRYESEVRRSLSPFDGLTTLLDVAGRKDRGSGLLFVGLILTLN